MANIFDNSCGLPDIPEPNYDFTGQAQGDCVLPLAPEPIFACDQLSIPPDPPPPPCPLIAAYASVTFAQVVGVVGVDAAVAMGSQDCQYAIDFNFTLPPAICPALGLSTHVTVEPGPPDVAVTITPGEASRCEFTLDFAFTLPPAVCPAIGAAATLHAEAGTPAVAVVVTPGETSHCAFTFDFAFTLPPAVCPVIALNATTTLHTGTPHVAATATHHAGSDCEFTFDFAFTLPPAICPALHAATTVTTSVGTPRADIVITQTGPASACEFQFDFHFTLPPAVCPTIQATGAVTVEYGSLANAPPAVDIAATRGTGSNCEIQLDFNFRLPAAPCPTFYGAATAVTSPSDTAGAIVTITRLTPDDASSLGVDLPLGFDPNACNFVFDFAFSIPSTPPPIDGCTLTAVVGTLDALAGATTFLFRKMILSGGTLVPGTDILTGTNRTSQSGVAGSYVTVQDFNDGELRLVSITDGGCLGMGSEGSAGGGGTTTDGRCGCCNCFNCIDTRHAIVGGCDACGNGAADQYTANLGVWPKRPELGGDILLKYSLHDTSSLAEETNGPCTWWTDPFYVSSEGQWASSTHYTVGQTVYNDGQFYECTTTGISAVSGGPNAPGTGITDNTCVWKRVP